MSRLVIRSMEEVDAALTRAEDLLGFVEGSPEEREMEEIAEAVANFALSLRLQSTTANDNGQVG